MTLMWIFNNIPMMTSKLTMIMRERSRMNYKRDRVNAELRAYTSLSFASMHEIRELHYLLNPLDEKPTGFKEKRTYENK